MEEMMEERVSDEELEKLVACGVDVARWGLNMGSDRIATDGWRNGVLLRALRELQSRRTQAESGVVEALEKARVRLDALSSFGQQHVTAEVIEQIDAALRLSRAPDGKQ